MQRQGAPSERDDGIADYDEAHESRSNAVFANLYTTKKARRSIFYYFSPTFIYKIDFNLQFQEDTAR